MSIGNHRFAHWDTTRNTLQSHPHSGDGSKRSRSSGLPQRTGRQSQEIDQARQYHPSHRRSPHPSSRWPRHGNAPLRRRADNAKAPEPSSAYVVRRPWRPIRPAGRQPQAWQTTSPTHPAGQASRSGHRSARQPCRPQRSAPSALLWNRHPFRTRSAPDDP